jgi:RNA polymerase sigma-70 factor (ECF subfamily)
MTSSGSSDERAVREERWRSLMHLAQGGDNAAYSKLLSELLPVLRGTVRRRWRSPQDIEDIVQDILMSVHSVRHTFDPGRPFMPWLMTITARRIADAARRLSSRAANETTVETMPETFSGDDTKSAQDTSDDQETIRMAMALLPEGQREAIELMKLQGLSLQEAAERTGKSVPALKVTVHRAIKAMRTALERKT